MKKCDTEKLISRMARALDRYVMIGKTPREFGTGILLYPSEIHAVEAIGKNPGMNVTEVATILGVSKPAISQIIKKLEKKHLVIRRAARDNNKEVLLHLSAAGKTVYENHRKFHNTIDKVIVARLNGLTGEQFSFLEEIIVGFEEYINLVLGERK